MTSNHSRTTRNQEPLITKADRIALPAAGAPADTAEPEVTITTQGADRHEEYRVRGQLYMIKVIPAKGKPYYLIDNEGSGQFSRSDFAPSIKVPMWVIKRF